MIDFVTFSVTLPYPTFAAFLVWMMMSFTALIGFLIYGLVTTPESYHRETLTLSKTVFLASVGIVLWPYLLHTAIKKGYY